jgi:hypothetical protein
MAVDSSATASIDLDADSTSAGAARAFMRKRLLGWGCPEELVGDVMLAVTELVSNAVLYAVPPFSATLTWRDGLVRIAVRDGSTLMPAPRNYGPDASTGRGLGLIDAVGRWGVELLAGAGKEVWAELGGGTGAPTVPEPRPSRRPSKGERTVRFLGVPVATYLALEAHNDALLRDFDLLAVSASQGGNVPPRLHEIVAEVHGQFSFPRAAYRRDVEAAAARGDALIDLSAPFTTQAVDPSVRYVELLEEAERFAGSGDLLAEPAPAPVARLRRWFVDEMTSQLLDGRPPRSAPRDDWPG